MLLFFKNNLKDIIKNIWIFLAILFLILIGFSVFNGILEYQIELKTEIFYAYNQGKLRDSYLDDKYFKSVSGASDPSILEEKVSNELKIIQADFKNNKPEFNFNFDSHQVFNFVKTTQNQILYYKFIQYNIGHKYFSNHFLRLKGKIPEKDDQILVNPQFLSLNHLKIGNKFHIPDVGTLTISGTCVLPQYLFYSFIFKNFPSYKTQTYILFNSLSPEIKNNLSQLNTETRQFQIKYSNSSLFSSQKKEATKLINNKFKTNKEFKDQPILFFDSFSNLDTFNYSIMNRIAAVNLFGYSVLFIIFFLTEFLIILVLKRKIQSNRYQFGIFKANGLSTFQLTIVNLAFPVGLLVVGGLLAVPLSYLIYTAIRIASISIFAFSLAVVPLLSNWLIGLWSFLSVSVFILVLSAIILFIQLRDKPLDLIRIEEEPIRYWKFAWSRQIFKNTPFLVRLRLSLFFNSIRKILFIFIATVSTTFLVALGILGVSFSPLIVKGANNAMKYEYMYKLTGNWKAGDLVNHYKQENKEGGFNSYFNIFKTAEEQPDYLFYPHEVADTKFVYEDNNQEGFVNQGELKPTQLLPWLTKVQQNLEQFYEKPSNNYHAVVLQKSFRYIHFEAVDQKKIILKQSKDIRPPEGKKRTKVIITKDLFHKSFSEQLWDELYKFASDSRFGIYLNIYPFLNQEIFYYNFNFFSNSISYFLNLIPQRWDKDINNYFGYISSSDLKHTDINIDADKKIIKIDGIINITVSRNFSDVKQGDNINFDLGKGQYKIIVHVNKIISDYNFNRNIYFKTTPTEVDFFYKEIMSGTLSALVLSDNDKIDNYQFLSLMTPKSLSDFTKIKSPYGFILNKEFILKVIKSNLRLVTIFFLVFAIVSLLISFFVMFVSFNIIVFENRKVISGMKLMGYKSGELSLTFLLIYLFFIILGIIIGLITNYFVLTFIIGLVMAKFKVSFILPYPWYIFLASFILIIILILFCYFLSKKQIEKISYRQIF